MRPSSRLPGFYQRPIGERVAAAAELVDAESAAWLRAGGGLELATADRMSENVIGTMGLPLGLALNVRVNQNDHLVPMAVEEPSVVAAASEPLPLRTTVPPVSAPSDMNPRGPVWPIVSDELCTFWLLNTSVPAPTLVCAPMKASPI